MLRTADPYLAFARAVRLFAPEWKPAAGVNAHAAVAADALIGRDVSIGAFVAIDSGVSIGESHEFVGTATSATLPAPWMSTLMSKSKACADGTSASEAIAAMTGASRRRDRKPSASPNTSCCAAV